MLHTNIRLCHRIINAVLCVMECLICEFGFVWNESDLVFIEIANIFQHELEWHGMFSVITQLCPKMHVNNCTLLQLEIALAKTKWTNQPTATTLYAQRNRTVTWIACKIKQQRGKNWVRCVYVTQCHVKQNCGRVKMMGTVRKCLVQRTINFEMWIDLNCTMSTHTQTLYWRQWLCAKPN